MTLHRRLWFSASTRVSAAYAALFSLTCLSLVYLPQWFVQVGLTTAQVGTVLAVAAIVKVPMTLLFGTAADLLAKRKGVLFCVGALLMAGMPLLLVVRDWFWLCVTWALLGGLISTCIPLTDSIAVTTVRRDDVSYGRMRMWGSLFFLATSLFTGWLIRDTGTNALVYMLIFAAAVLLCCVLGLPNHSSAPPLAPAPVAEHGNIPDAPRRSSYTESAVTDSLADKDSVFNLTSQQSNSGWKLALAALLPVIRLPGFMVFLCCAATLMASHAALYSLSTVYWSAAGISLPMIGFLWAVGVVAEIGFFFIARTLVNKWDPWQLLLIAGVTGVVRWTITALVTDVQILIVIQAMHAVTFTFTQLAVVTYIGNKVPEELTSSAQSIYDSCALGIVFGLALYVSGSLSRIDVSWSFFAMAALSATGCSIAAYRVLSGR